MGQICRAPRAPEELVKKYRAKGFPNADLNKAKYPAALGPMDTAIGPILTALDETKLAAKTMGGFPGRRLEIRGWSAGPGSQAQLEVYGSRSRRRTAADASRKTIRWTASRCCPC